MLCLEPNPTRSYLIYDDTCNVCTRFARIVKRLSKSRILILGHYSDEGIRLKARYFPPGDRPEEMFWLIRGDTCYGGRSGLLALLGEIVRVRMS